MVKVQYYYFEALPWQLLSSHLAMHFYGGTDRSLGSLSYGILVVSTNSTTPDQLVHVEIPKLLIVMATVV